MAGGSRGGGAGGAQCLPSALQSAVSGLFTMDGHDSPPTPKGSLRKFLEQLSGAGKAIGVLTSGGDAQGAPPGPRVPGPGRGAQGGDQ